MHWDINVIMHINHQINKPVLILSNKYFLYTIRIISGMRHTT